MKEVDLYPWPLGPRKAFFTKEAMARKLFWSSATLVLIFGFGAVWILLNQPGSSSERETARLAQERMHAKALIKQCCLQDIRSAQEALTSLSVEARKLRVRLDTDSKKPPVGPKLLTVLVEFVDESRTLWDQLESLLEDPHEDWKRQLRDIRINMDGLVEQFMTVESCCASGLFPPLMKEYLQIAAYRFGVVHGKIMSTQMS